MKRDREVELKLGIPSDPKQVKLTIPDDEPTPWDLDSRFTVMGKRHPRLDGILKVTGRAKYTHDINLPDLLYGGFVRCPHAKANIEAIDTSRAESHPAVKAVIKDEDGLARRQVRYAGEPVCAIAATTRQGLEEAIALVEARYEVLPHAARIDQAMAEGAPRVHGDRDNVQRAGRRESERQREQRLEREAKVADALKAARNRIEATCTTQVQTHSCLETHGSVAKWDGDHLTLWTSTQATFGVRQQIASALKIPESQVTVISEFMGGGFGSKFPAGYWSLMAARLARLSGHPVKIMLDRHEEHLDVGNRPDSIQEMALAVGDDGKLGAYKVDIHGTPGVGQGAGARNPMIYDFPGDLTAKSEFDVATNAGAQMAFRAPGHPQGSFAMETLLNLAAAQLGIDPLELRRKNDPDEVRQVQYTEGARRIGWVNRKPDGSATGRFRRGLGVASSIWYNLGGPRAEILCKIRPDASIEIRSGAQDIGTGTRTIMSIVAAEELGLPLSAITSFIGNTNDPIGPGSGGSKTAPSIAPAARQAAYLAGEELRGLVAREMGCAASDLVCRSGQIVHLQDAAKAVSFKDACRLINGEISALGKRKQNWRDATYKNTVAGVQFADVEVDCDFGIVRVKRVVALQDAGLIIDRLTAESQVAGGVIQGVSYALLEERHVDRQKGLMLNTDLEMYKIIGTADMPEIEVVLHDVANGANNTSTMGIGEPPTIPTAAAIGGAVQNALGVPIKSLPITPDKVLAALEEQEKGR